MSRFGAFPRSTALRCRSSGASCLGEGRNPSPSFASSRQGSTNRLSQPPSSFSYPSISQDYLLLRAYFVGAHPLATDARRGNVRRREADMCLPHPPGARTSPPAKDKGGRGRNSLEIFSVRDSHHSNRRERYQAVLLPRSVAFPMHLYRDARVRDQQLHTSPERQPQIP